MRKLPAPTSDTPTIDELKNYLSDLKPDTQPRWGKMNSTEMCKHTNNFILLYLGEKSAPFFIRIIARLMGGIFLRKILKSSPTETPKNMNTLPTIKVEKEDLDFEFEQKQLMESLSKVEKITGVIDHPLYGSMEAEDVVALIRHHTAHHFNQFGLLKGNVS
jgi:hypothetical protein